MPRMLAIAMGATLALSAIGATPALAAVEVTFEITTNTFGFVSGTAPENEIVHLVLRDSHGTLRGRVHTQAHPGGRFDTIFPVLSTINAGDTLKARVSSYSRTWKIPPLEATIDRVGDTISGRTAPDTEVTLVYTPWKTTQPSPATQLTSDHHGAFSTDVGFDIRGGDGYYVSAQFGTDSIVNRVLAPFVEVMRGQNLVEGFAADTTPVTLTLRTEAGHVRATATVTPVLGTEVIASLQNAGGHPVYPRPGDVLDASIASDAVLAFAPSGLHADATTDRVWGRCMPNSQYQLTVQSDFSQDDFGYAQVYGHADDRGYFSRNLSDRIDVDGGDSLSLVCRFPSGDMYLLSDEVHLSTTSGRGSS